MSNDGKSSKEAFGDAADRASGDIHALSEAARAKIEAIQENRTQERKDRRQRDRQTCDADIAIEMKRLLLEQQAPKFVPGGMRERPMSNKQLIRRAGINVDQRSARALHAIDVKEKAEVEKVIVEDRRGRVETREPSRERSVLDRSGSIRQGPEPTMSALDKSTRDFGPMDSVFNRTASDRESGRGR